MKQLALILGVVITLSACQNQNNTNAGDNSKKPDQTDTASTTDSKKTENVKKPKEDKISKGIDVSHFNGSVNWEEVDGEEFSFAYAKATEGKYFVDPDFSKNWNGIAKSGMKRGAYHFYVAKDDGKAQAVHFLTTVSDWDAAKDMAPVLDLEGSSIDGKSVEDYQNNVLDWLNAVEEKLGVQPIIYTDNPFANQFLNNQEFAKYKLWIAQYTDAKEPEIPALWKEAGWYMWQHKSRGDVKGVSGNVDEDYLKS